MKKVAIIGKFDTVNGISDGQAVKTNILAQEIEQACGAENVIRISTYGWKKAPLRLFGQSILAVWRSENVIFMTDEGGIRVFPWLLRLANIAGRCKLHYAVVGGWLLHFPEKHKILSACLKGFDGIYVETTAMKRGLERHGFQNLQLMPNCKRLRLLQKEDLEMRTAEPHMLCTFSRVMREKGIADAVGAVREVNERYGRAVYTLDIYGQIDPDQKQWFEDLSNSFPSEIRYCGIAEYDRSVEVLKDYYALLFPTGFYTEGVPGTIIDAYAAGVPVISSKWESFSDVVEDGRTGIGYDFSKPEMLRQILMELAASPERMSAMKECCLEKAQAFLPENTLGVLLDALGIPAKV